MSELGEYSDLTCSLGGFPFFGKCLVLQNCELTVWLSVAVINYAHFTSFKQQPGMISLLLRDGNQEAA